MPQLEKVRERERERERARERERERETEKGQNPSITPIELSPTAEKVSEVGIGPESVPFVPFDSVTNAWEDG
jgi:hypothetical protein